MWTPVGLRDELLREIRKPVPFIMPTKAPSSPVTGQGYFDAESGKIYIYHPNGWKTYSED